MGIAALRHHLNVKITLKPFLSYDAFGKPTFSTAKTFPARIEGSKRLLRTAKGEQVESSRKIFADTGQGSAAYIPDPRDEITLPEQFWPSTRKAPLILEVEIQNGPGAQGVDHVVLYV
jgi:hypothetical protein